MSSSPLCVDACSIAPSCVGRLKTTEISWRRVVQTVVHDAPSRTPDWSNSPAERLFCHINLHSMPHASMMMSTADLSYDMCLSSLCHQPYRQQQICQCRKVGTANGALWLPIKRTRQGVEQSASVLKSWTLGKDSVSLCFVMIFMCCSRHESLPVSYIICA